MQKANIANTQMRTGLSRREGRQKWQENIHPEQYLLGSHYVSSTILGVLSVSTNACHPKQ